MSRLVLIPCQRWYVYIFVCFCLITASRHSYFTVTWIINLQWYYILHFRLGWCWFFSLSFHLWTSWLVSLWINWRGVTSIRQTHLHMYAFLFFWCKIGRFHLSTVHLTHWLITLHTQTLGYGQALQQALIKLQVGNLGNMNPDHLYSEYHYSHPPLVERLHALRALDKKSG